MADVASHQADLFWRRWCEAPRLELADQYLSRFERSEQARAHSVVAWQPRAGRLQPPQRRIRYPATAAPNDGSGQVYGSLNWLINDSPLTTLEVLKLEVLNHVLLGTAAATLRKRLTDSGIGAAVIGGGLDMTLQQATFTVGLKGLASESDVAALEALIISCLEEAADRRLDPAAIEASLNTIEFSLREFNTGGFPKGLMVFLGALGEWVRCAVGYLGP